MRCEEKVPYLKTLLFIAVADNSISKDELECFSGIGLSSGLTDEDMESVKDCVLNQKESIENIIKGITSYDTKLDLIYNLLNLCYIDGDYSVMEKHGMQDVCALLNIDNDELLKIEEEVTIDHKNGELKEKHNFLYGKIVKAFDIGKVEAVVASKKIVMVSSSVAHSLATGIGIVSSKISISFERAKKLLEENKALREKLKTNTLTEAIKQKVILQLNAKIINLTTQLKIERQRNQRNEEIIDLLQAQIDDLNVTREVAEKAKIA